MSPSPEKQAFEALMVPISVSSERWPAALLHYTRAETLLHVLSSRSLLFSASSVMNDRDELWGALDIIRETLVPSRAFNEWRARMNSNWPEFMAAFITYFDNSVWRDRENLYLFCWCASSPQHPTGKLSMWRAYGDDGKGIALAINAAPLLAGRDSATLPVQLHPTRYESDAEFCLTLLAIAYAFETHLDVARALAAERGMDDACWWLFQAWFVAAATRKHPGFSEEDEWRFIYLPSWDGDGVLTGGMEVQAVGGQLRPCFRLPIRDYADLGMPGTDIKDILDCVIVGPNTFDALAARRAAEMELRKAGVADPQNKVQVCTTPYRTPR